MRTFRYGARQSVKLKSHPEVVCIRLSAHARAQRNRSRPESLYDWYTGSADSAFWVTSFPVNQDDVAQPFIESLPVAARKHQQIVTRDQGEQKNADNDQFRFPE